MSVGGFQKLCPGRAFPGSVHLGLQFEPGPGPQVVSQGFLLLQLWPFRSDKYWTNPIYRMYNPIYSHV